MSVAPIVIPLRSAVKSHSVQATPSARAEATRRALAEQLAPVVALYAELRRRWSFTLDLDRACSRVRTGACAFDPLAVIESAGELALPFLQATKALERAGLVSNEEATRARGRRPELVPLLAEWLAGDAAPRDPVRAVARRAAALVGGSILHRAATDVRERLPLDELERRSCPCCGGPAEFALGGAGPRLLICARCDTAWRSPGSGCLGCDATEEPTLAHVFSPALDYRIVICNACGRYVKERRTGDAVDPVLERSLTALLDEAAEARGLRL